MERIGRFIMFRNKIAWQEGKLKLVPGGCDAINVFGSRPSEMSDVVQVKLSKRKFDWFCRYWGRKG